MTVEIIHGDCVEVLATLEPDSFHACVTDPPYHLISIVKRFGSETAAPVKPGATGVYARSSKGFMGKTWDGGDIAFRPETWAAVYRVLKPGAHLLAFGGTRTFHRLVCAIEDAGFEIRDTVMWLYGSGFPKSRDVSKAIDRAAGIEREMIGIKRKEFGGNPSLHAGEDGAYGLSVEFEVTAPATDAARQWQGWGTALKPACELICVARKPLSEGTVAANVLKHGTGALNIDDSRIPAGDKAEFPNGIISQTEAIYGGGKGRYGDRPRTPDASPSGRWPPNVAHDGSPEVLDAFAKFGESKSSGGSGDASRNWQGNGYTVGGYIAGATGGFGDTGTAARFFKECPPDAPEGRWPANVAHDGSPEVLDAFAKFGEIGGGYGVRGGGGHVYAEDASFRGDGRIVGFGDTGTAARFFYTAKAGADERCDSKHPTVKPVALMEWLVRLVSPSGGRVIDPFCGTGSTLVACDRLGFDALGIEQDAQTVKDALEKIKRMRARRMIGDAEKSKPAQGQMELEL